MAPDTVAEPAPRLQRWQWVSYTGVAGGQVFYRAADNWYLTVARKVLDRAQVVNDDFLDGLLAATPGYTGAK